MSTAGVMLRFTYSDQTTSPPGNTHVRFNVAVGTIAEITHLWVDYSTDDGIDAFHFLLAIQDRDEIVIQDVDDHTRAIHLRVTAAPADRGTYAEFAVAAIAWTGAAFANNQDVMVLVLEQPAQDTDSPTPPTPPAYPVCGAYAGSYGLPNINRLIAGPGIEPLTLDEAKLRAGLDWPPGDPRDAQMASFIRAARERVERDTGYALLTQTREVYLSRFVHTSEFPPPCRPLQSIEIIPSPEPVVYPIARRIVVGWPTPEAIPPLLYFAVGLLTAHYATAARDVVVVGTITQVIPMGYEDAIADYRAIGV